jgi:hypothetical protein
MNLEYLDHYTVSFYGLFIFIFFLADHKATDFTRSQICGTATTTKLPRIRRTFQQYFSQQNAL